MSKLLARFKNILPKYLVAAVLIIVPLFPKFPLLNVPGTYVAIRFEDILLLILAIVTFAKILTNLKGFLNDKINLAFIIFFGVNLISLASGIFLTKTVVPQVGILNYLRRLEYLIPFFAVLNLFTFQEIKNNLSFYIKIFIVVTLITFVYGLGQRYLSFPIIITQNDQYSKGVALRWTPGSHINSTFAGHYDLAGFTVLILPIFIALLFGLKNWLNKIWLLAATGGGMWLLINSLSRISQVSYLAAISVSLLILRKFKALGAVFIISLILIGLSSSLQARFLRVIDVFYDKVKTVKLTGFEFHFIAKAETQTLPLIKPNLPSPTPSPIPVFEDRSTSIRLQVEWPRAIRAFEINPLLGTGYSSITLATDNDFLRMLGETGLLGFAAFWLIFAGIGKFFLSALSGIGKMTPLEKGFVVGVTGGIIGTFIGAFFIDLFEASKFATLFWFMVGYGLVIVKNYVTTEDH